MARLTTKGAKVTKCGWAVRNPPGDPIALHRVFPLRRRRSRHPCGADRQSLRQDIRSAGRHLLSNAEVTDRRVNWHGRRQRIRRANCPGPRRFGGLNGSTGYGPPHHEGRESHEDRMRNPQPARRSDCPPSCAPAPGSTKPTRLRSRRPIPAARHSICWFLPSLSDHSIRSSCTRRSRCGSGSARQSLRRDSRSARCHFHCRTTKSPTAA